MSRFTKLDAALQPLPADATGHVAVLDNQLNLIWSVDNVGGKRLNWAEAKEAVATLDLGGKTDWRLPTVEELFLLADRTRFEPAIDTDAFPACESSFYWSGTADASSSDCAWGVGFHGGSSGWSDVDDEAFVRAVRAPSQ
jgi:hypothetical protein